MKGIIISLTIYSFIILLGSNGNAWMLPMVKYSHNIPQSAEELNADESTITEDLKAVIGIKVVKFTRHDPAMRIFDFDMDLARKFAYKQWQNLLSVYFPAPTAQIEEVTVRLPVLEMHTENVTQVQKQSKLMKTLMEAKKEYDEDAPQRVAQALADMYEKNDLHKSLQ
uniref:Uncharacterized protein n=1 Tax=Ceratitis capitata TaxID=7213 RepID=W8BY52_CERCA